MEVFILALVFFTVALFVMVGCYQMGIRRGAADERAKLYGNTFPPFENPPPPPPITGSVAITHEVSTPTPQHVWQETVNELHSLNVSLRSDNEQLKGEVARLTEDRDTFHDQYTQYWKAAVEARLQKFKLRRALRNVLEWFCHYKFGPNDEPFSDSSQYQEIEDLLFQSRK